jgi:hypothetical protein
MAHTYFHPATKATMAKAPISCRSQHTTSSALGFLSFYDLIPAVAVIHLLVRQKLMVYIIIQSDIGNL